MDENKVFLKRGDNMIVTTEQLLQQITDILGDRTDDESLSLLENASDTLNQYTDAENWKQKYEDNDKEWRERYKKRFMGEDDNPPMNDPEETMLTYEQLFE